MIVNKIVEICTCKYFDKEQAVSYMTNTFALEVPSADTFSNIHNGYVNLYVYIKKNILLQIMFQLDFFI